MRTISIFLALHLLLATITNAQNPNIDSATTAIRNLNSLKQATPQLQSQINNLNYGPYNLQVQCRVCSYHVIWCVEYDNYTYTWQFPDYTNYLNSFKSLNQQLFTDLSSFQQYYQPLSNWFLTTLPNINNDFQSLSVSNETNLMSNLQKTLADVNAAQAALNSAISNLGSWNTTINNDFNNLGYNTQNMQYAISSDSNSVRTYMNGMACGSDNLFNNWTNTKNTASSQITNFMSFASGLGVSNNGIDQNLACILSPLIAMQFNLNNIQSRLQNAQITSSAAVQLIDKLVAVGVWQELLTVARSNF